MTKNSKFKKFLVLVIVLVAISVSVLIVNAAQTEEQVNDTQNQTEVTDTASNSNISTYFHEASGTLIVSGEGELEDFYPRGYEVIDDGIGEPVVVPITIVKIDTSVKHLIIEEGITSLYNSFNDLHNLETISFPASLKSIDTSFLDCDKIKTLTFPSKIEKIDSSFNSCYGVTDINFSGGAVDIVNCFCNLACLDVVNIPAESTLNDSFGGCKNIEKFIFGSGVKLEDHVEFLNSGFVNENLVIVADKNDEMMLREYFHSYYDRLNFAYYSTTPEKLNVTSQANGIKLDWEAKLTADTYHIYRKANGESNWTKVGDTKASSYFDTSVENNKTYTYMLKVDDSADGVTAKLSYISAPELTKITNEADGIRVYWGKVTGADGYYLYRRVTGTKDWTRIATIKKGSTVSYKDTKAAAGKTYDYIIRAYSGNVTSAPAEKVIRTMRLTVPSLTSVSNGKDGITIKWKKVAGADSYIVYRKTYDAKAKKWSGWERISDGNTSNSYTNYYSNRYNTVNSIESGVRYKYTVKACYGSYTSYYNTSGLDILSLETPELSSATSTKAGVKLQWNKITGASGYKIYRKTANSGWGEAIATVKGNSTVTYLDKTAKKGVTYTYTVRAYNGNTKSGYIASGKTVTDKY
ncbi:MAG: hypothetical protein E7530_02340 [Ruminococcaceae bacterium]|nr:hypothetical protein [Oscillospiraceae bacterium]